MDLVSITLSMCIGNMVAWLLAIYTPRGAYNLVWNVAIGSLGAAALGLAVTFAWPALGIGGLLFGGPVAAWLAILAGYEVRARLGLRLTASRTVRKEG